MAASDKKGMLAKAAGTAFNGMYRVFSLGKRRNEVLFVSRKSDTPSYDYLECGKAFERNGLKPVYLSAHFKDSSKAGYFKLVMQELYHLARCKVCVIDRYDPVVSMINFKSESEPRSAAVHNELPVEPVVVQLWHAFGAFKKFGFQSLDVAEGHSSEEAEQFQIHRNNSWVVCSGEGARAAFAEAFGCPIERVVPLSRPEYRKILDLRGRIAAVEVVGAAAAAGWAGEAVRIDAAAGQAGNDVQGAGTAESCGASGRSSGYAAADSQVAPGHRAGGRAKPIVMFAPTIRKYDRAMNPFDDLKRNGFEDYYAQAYQVQWSDHPLVAGGDARGDVPDGLLHSQVVVTDYSSIVYEAYLLHKMVAFYVPDIAHYRTSPGLNIDPEELCPSLVAKNEMELNELLYGWLRNPATYPWEELEAFVGDAFTGCGYDPAMELVGFLGERYPGLLGEPVSAFQPAAAEA